MSDLSTNKSVVEHLQELCEEDNERHVEAQIALGWARRLTDSLCGIYVNEPTYKINAAALEKNIVEQFGILFPFLVGVVRPRIEWLDTSHDKSPKVSIAKMSAVDRLGQIT